MKAQLVKIDYQFFLYNAEDDLIGTTEQSPYQRLSMKNCQAIEDGYDLDELVKSKYPNFYNEDYEYDVEAEMLRDEYKSRGFKEGFQKALELMGDKKFSEDDVHQALHLMNNRTRIPISGEALDIIAKIEKQRNEIIQSLQQTQWDVEIEMICPHPSDTYVCGIQYGCDEDGCNHPNQVPYLDADGCLILKLKCE